MEGSRIEAAIEVFGLLLGVAILIGCVPLLAKANGERPLILGYTLISLIVVGQIVLLLFEEGTDIWIATASSAIALVIILTVLNALRKYRDVDKS